MAVIRDDADRSVLHGLYRQLPGVLREPLVKSGMKVKNLREIRLRAKRPVMLNTDYGECFLTKEGTVTNDFKYALCFSSKELWGILEYFCDSSIYAYGEEIKKGFLTLPGGHRVGICGSVCKEAGDVSGVRYVTGLNIRVAHEKKGVAGQMIDRLFSNQQFLNTLVISSPGCGKTTLLRDIVRIISDQKMLNVSVVDERNEIAACYHGTPQNDIGIRTDVIDNCEKLQGMQIVLRVMNPQVIAVDEIGSAGESEMIKEIAKSGCKMIATAHCSGIEEAKGRKWIWPLIEQGLFKRIIVLQKDFSAKLYDNTGKELEL